MVKQNYAYAYKEVIELLKYFSLEDIEKIPEDLLNVFFSNMDKEYEYKVDVNKTFEEQIMLEETKVIFAIIFRDYWATENQKQRIMAKEENDKRKEEEEKARKYPVEDLFNSKNICEEELPVVASKETLLNKIINKIKNILMITKKSN